MPASSDKQQLQVHNIVNTLLEATEHFHNLIRDKQLNQSIFIFSSIVEGFDAVSNMITKLDDKEWIKQKESMDKYLLMIAQQLEQGRFLKISEILQFSFLPLLKRTEKFIADSIGSKNQNKAYSIGVFASFRNPREFYTEPRVNALVQESERQNVQLLFFTSNDVDFDKKEIKADVCNNEKWERISTPFPDVINNVSAGKRSHIERKLRRQIPFTSFHVGNKYYLPKKIVQNRKYAELLVPFRVCLNDQDIHQFLEKNHKVVLKALLSNRGENIFFVTKKGNRYSLYENKKERILNQEAFNIWLHTIILKKKGSYIIQRYIHTRTNYDEPYHFRAQVQKNGEGKWVITLIYASIGAKRSNLSNLSAGGRSENLHDFLIDQYGEAGKVHEQNIVKISLELAHHLDKIYSFALDELGIDLAIDDQGKYWMHEANNGPQTGFFEEKRAVNTIAYAKYIAKNGIVRTDNTKYNVPGQFHANTSNPPYVELKDRLVIGMLVGKNVNYQLAIESAKAAEAANMFFYSFAPLDIDLDKMLIKGHFYRNEEWIAKTVEYPDVIFDHLKQRGNPNTQMIYEELEDIPFTNEWPNRLFKRSEINENLQENGELGRFLPPFQKVTRMRDIFRYLETYGKILLTPEIGAFTNVRYIENHSNVYKVTIGTSIKKYNELPLRHTLKDLLQKENFIVQKDTRTHDANGQSFTICTHLMLGKEGNWQFVSLYPEVNLHSVDLCKKDVQEELTAFLQRQYGERDAANFAHEIIDISKHVVTALSMIYSEMLSEAAIIFRIDENQQIKLVEVNPSGPDRIYDAEKMAASVIGYADYLVSLNTDPQIER